jgi:hypothetical protein
MPGTRSKNSGQCSRRAPTASSDTSTQGGIVTLQFSASR